MSYCRFSEADVYVFTTSTGIECCACSLQDREWVDEPGAFFGGYLKPIGELVLYLFDSNQGMIDHLEIHRAKGDYVPERVFKRLRDPEDEARNKQIWESYKKRSESA